MLQASIDRFRGSVARAGPIEVGQDAVGPLLQGSAESSDLDQRGGAPMDRVSIRCCILAFPLVAVGADHRLVDTPRRLALKVRLVDEQVADPLPLLVGERVSAGA